MAQLCTPELVVEILHERVGVPADVPQLAEATWQQLGVDSLALAEVCAALERTLECEIEDGAVYKTQSVPELVALINSQAQVSA